MSGTSGFDEIHGGSGNDHLDAGAGDDFLYGDGGDDIIDGGPGFDVAFLSTGTGPLVINLVTGISTGTYEGTDDVRNIEHVMAGGRGDITIIGSDANEYLQSYGYGKNNVSGGGGNDGIGDSGPGSVLDGGSGINQLALYRWDTYDGGKITAPFTHTFAPGVSGTMADGTRYSNFDYYYINTGDGDDTVTFNQLKKRLSPDFLFGFGNGWRAGKGNDTAIIDLSNYSTMVLMNPDTYGSITINDNGSPGTTNVISLEGVENVRVAGGSAADWLTAGSGSDVLTGNGGDDRLDGGEGADMARYSGAASSYRIDTVSSTSYKVVDLRGGSPDGSDTLNNIERLQWGDGSVTVLFNSPPILLTRDSDQMVGQSLALSSLFSVSDVDGNAMTRYQLWDANRDPSSGYFVVNGAPQPAGSVIDISAAQLGQTFFVTGTIDDSLQIRAYDGNRWSASDSAAWAPFSIAVDNPPVIATQNMNVAANTLLSLTSLISDSDVDGDFRSRYQLWDSTRDPNSGYFIVDGVAQAASTVIEITAEQLNQTFFKTGTVDDDLQARVFDGTFWSAAETVPWAPFKIGPHVNRKPTLSFSSPVSVPPGQSIALSSMVTATDPDNDTITRYQFWDSNRDPQSGFFVVAGVVKSPGTIIDVTAAQLSQTFFVVGVLPDAIQGRNFDGAIWSFGENDVWAQATITPPANHAPVLTTSNLNQSRNQTLSLSSLISVTDGDGDSMTKYQLWDSNRDPSSGSFTVNGTVQAAGSVIEISAAQLAQTFFVTGKTGDVLQVRAYDGAAWSAGDNAAWSPFAVNVANNAPVMTTGNVTKAHLQSYALSSLFSVTDADADAMTKYQLWDSNRDPNSGYFTVNGVARAAGTVIEITAAQLAQTSFVTGSVGDGLQIRAFDGISWSASDTAAWSPFTVSVAANNAPVVTTGTITPQHGRSLALSSLISVSDGDGDSMTKYQLWDSSRDPASGYWMVNGVAQTAGTVIEISATQLAQTSFVTGKIGDNLQVRAFDGIDWSAGDNAAWSPFAVSVTSYTAPSLTTQDINTSPGLSLALSSLISVSDPDGDSMTKYQLWDSSRDAASGHFVVNGVAQSAGTMIDVTAAQLGLTSFLTGTIGDALQIRAFDGISWTAADTASWAPFHINV